MKSLKSFVLKEAVAMINQEWSKPHGKTGQDRLDILKQLIAQDKPIELAKGGTFKVADKDDAFQKIDNYDKTGRSVIFTLNATDGKVYRNTQIAKSKVFGGGTGGAGGGTANTKLTESHNCLMLSAMLIHGHNHDIEYFTPEILKGAFKGIDVDEKDTDKLLALEGPWFTSSYNISKLLIEKGYVKKGMKLYRGTTKMVNIYTGKDIAFKNTGFKPLKDDKWNPGDIWAIEDGFDFNKELDVSNITAYNKSILEHFSTRRVVGISLKGPEVKYPPPLKTYNNQVPPDIDLHKYMGCKLESDRGNYWSAKNGQILFDAGVLMVKDNTAGGTIKAEIKGKNARGGGISWGPMQDYVQRETRKKLPDHASGIRKMAKNIEAGKERDIKAYYTLFNHFYKNISYNEFKEELKQKDWTWISAKLALNYLCYYIDKSGGKTANALVTHFVNYAGSKGAESAVYVKAGK